MAYALLCDGCNAQISDAPNERGTVIKRTYCHLCAPKIDDFLTKRDAIHDAAVKIWADGMTALIDEYRDAVPALLKLPDVQDD